MRMLREKLISSKWVRFFIKGILSLVVLAMVFAPIINRGTEDCISHKNYKDTNYFNSLQTVKGGASLTYEFEAKGNYLSNLVLYFGATNGQSAQIKIQTVDGTALQYVEIPFDEYTPNNWNRIAFDFDGLRRGEQYEMTIDNPGTEAFELGGIEYQFVYQYLTFANVFEYGLKNAILLMLVLMLCTAIFQFEKLVKHYRTTPKKTGFLYAVYLAMAVTLSFNPLSVAGQAVGEFKREIGLGIISNVDVSKRVANFNHWFVLFGVSFILFFLLMNYCLSRNYEEQERKVIKALDHIIVLADLEMVFRGITYFNNQESAASVFYYTPYLLIMLLFAEAAYLVLRLHKKINANGYTQLLVVAFSAAFPIAIISRLEWLSGKLLLAVQFILLLAFILLLKIGKPIQPGKLVSRGIATLCAGFCTIPFATSFYIEFVNILNQHGVFVTRLRYYYAVAMAAIGCATLAFSLIAVKRKWELPNWKRWVYPVLVFGIGCLYAQIGLEITYNSVNVIEQANYSILISDFLNFGSIPIVEHYGGHMMTSVWEGLIYALLNNDFVGAAYSPYLGYTTVLLAVLFFYCVKYAWNEDMALLTTIAFPFYAQWYYFGWCMLVCLAFISYEKKSNYVRAALVWLAFIWCAFYRLDIGFAIGFGCIFSLIVYAITFKKKEALKHFGVTLILWGAAGVVAWFGICAFKGIPPIDRLKEFLLVSLSNLNWGYDGIGNTANTVFAWTYLFIPMAVIISVIWTTFSSRLREQAGKERWIIMMFLGLSYLANFSRGLVRHSLAEGRNMIVSWSAFIFLAIFISSACNRKRVFLPVFAAFILCNSILMQTQNYTGGTFINSAVVNTGRYTESWTLNRFDDDNPEAKTYWEEIAEKNEITTRVVKSESVQDEFVPYQWVMDTLLEKDDTFVDFINVTLAYSEFNRKNPVYVSQSPMQLSGETTQEMFVQEMTGVPVVLMPLGNAEYHHSQTLDRVTNAYRNYRVAEYIYQHYVPLCRCDDVYAVWCLPERYDEMKDKLYAAYMADFTAVSAGKDMILHNCELIDTDDGLVIAYTGDDPFVSNFDKLIDTTSLIDQNMVLAISYETDVSGIMQVFYTTEKEEKYSQEKSVRKNINGRGTVYYTIPVTAQTSIRLDTPEKSTVKITGIRTSEADGAFTFDLIDYGYDGPVINEQGTAVYTGALHHHSIDQLPRIWAETDKKNAAQNAVITQLTNEGNGVFAFDHTMVPPEENGNYLLIRASWFGYDGGSLYRNDDETLTAVVKLGLYADDKFTEAYKYTMTLSEGTHDYLIRVSTDYYWYLGNVNAVCIEVGDKLHDVSMSILEGD